MTNDILISNDRMAAFQMAIESLAKRGIITDYKVTPEGQSHQKIQFGDSWASVIFQLGYEFHKAEKEPGL